MVQGFFAVLAGVWVLCQLFGGDLLGRLKLL
jgi:hypothetical protein